VSETPDGPVVVPSPVRERRLRRAGLALAALMVLLLAGIGAGSWYYADQIMARADQSAPEQATLTAVSPRGTTATVRLRGGEFAGTAQIVGLRTPTGYLQLGPPTGPVTVESGQTVATRPATLISGTWPAAGARGDLDTDAFPADDPAVALAGKLTQVNISGPLGGYPAWQVDGTKDTWVVFVHGRGGSRAEGLRLLSVTSRLGYPALAITYRNDTGAPPAPDRRNHWGLTEWADLQAAVDYLKSRGVQHLVLAGASMGGAIVATFLRRSPDAGMVRATVLDAPVLSMQALLRLQAADRGLPGPVSGVLLPFAKAIADWRGDLDFSALEQTPAELRVPVLLFHGAADTSVPVGGSDAFAAAGGDQVRYVRVDGADHVASWNVARARYEEAVTQFLANHAT
jgi:alpha-beta hydrolase superfamily lysophospholipase